MTTEINSPALALKVIEAIKVDMAAGTVPVAVSTFSELHDYVDANEYLIDAVEGAGIVLDAESETQGAKLNRIMDMVNVWLGAKRG